MTRLNLPVSGAPTHWFVGSTPGTTVSGTTGNDQLVANGSNITLVGFGGDDTFIVYDPSDLVIETANSGISTVETWGAGYTLPANVQNLTLQGSADAYAVGNSLDNIITANSGNDRIIAGTGNDILVSGSGNDTFVISAGDGVDELQNFHAGDVVALQGFGFASFADVHAAMTQSGADTVLNLGGNQSITFDNMTIGSFNAADFDLPFHPTGMVMSFDDEFNTLSLNIGGHPGTWNTTFYGGARTIPGDGELEEYMDSAYTGTSSQPLGVNPFTINNGILTISAQPTDASVAPYINNTPYTSGLLTTEGTFAQTYGYWEIKAQLPSGDGLWPAFWLLPADHSWPPEVDIFEVLGKDPNTVYDTFHGSDGGGASQAAHVGNLAVGFHTFGFNWTPSTMTWYVDGLQTYQIATPAYMDKPMYMLIDLAVGGSWPGPPDGTTRFPANLKIDYVHVYSPAPPPPAPSNLALDPSTDSGVKGDNITNVARPEIDGQGVAGDTITLYDGSAAVGTGIVGSGGSWQIVSSALTNGTHILTATQTDAAGNTSVTSAPLSLTIATVSPPPAMTPAGTTADLILRDSTGASSGQLQLYDLGNNMILGANTLGNVGLSWQVMGTGDFAGNPNEADVIMRDSNTGNVEFFDIQSSQIVSAGSMGRIGAEWLTFGVGNVSGNANETDVVIHNTNNGGLYYFDIQHDQLVSAGLMGSIGAEWQSLGAGDFSSIPGETDILMRNTNNGGLYYLDIQHNQLVGLGPMGTIGLEWQALGVGNFSSNANETDLLMRDSQNGAVDVFDIQHNQLVGISAMGTIGAEWQALGVGDISGIPGENDLVMRNTQTGAIFAFDIQHNQFVNIKSMGTVGAEWQPLGVGSPLVPGSPLI